MLMAVAIFGVIMFEEYSAHFVAALQSVAIDGDSRALIDARLVDLAGMKISPALDPESAGLVQTAIHESFVAGFRVVALAAAAIALLCALIAALTIPPRAIKA